MDRELSQKAKELKEKLNLIGWDIKGFYPNAWIWNHKKQRTMFRVLGDRIEVEDRAVFGNPKNRFSQGAICFYFSDSEITVLDSQKPDCISVGNKNIFVNFYNHD